MEPQNLILPIKAHTLGHAPRGNHLPPRHYIERRSRTVTDISTRKHKHQRPLASVSEAQALPRVSILVPCFGVTNFILRILKCIPKEGAAMETIGRACNFGDERSSQQVPLQSTLPRQRVPMPAQAALDIGGRIHLDK